MKRTASIAGMLFLAALGLAAAVWDGSAVAGGAGDFPDDGFYGACNSFPHDTSVTVTNLENGKAVTVTITRNVDNPGVFIALSPKAAAELGMHAGAAVRIRAVALIASQADTSLPPTRAGETADPDYNPKVYVEREKAAVAAAAAAPAASEAPSIAAAAAPQAIARAALPVPEAATGPENAEVLARTGEPPKQPIPMPSLTEPRSAALDKATAPAVAVKPAVAAKPATPVAPPPAATSPAQAPEVLGDAKPAPRKTAPPRMVIADPALPSATTPAATPGAAVAKGQEKASVDSLARPPRMATPPYKLALVEPSLDFGPDELPDAIVNRITAPIRVVPNPELAEAPAPSDAGTLRKGPEAFAFEKPSYAEAVEAAALGLGEADLPGSPNAISDRRTAGEGNATSELQSPDLPRPSEGLAIERPRGEATEAVAAELEEPGVITPALTGMGPTVLADARRGPSAPPYADLVDPGVPKPTESLTAGKPTAVAPGQAIAELAEPNLMTATAIAAEKPAQSASVPTELTSPAVPKPTESLAAVHPKVATGGERTITLEPASPRPPVSAAAAAAPVTAPVVVAPKIDQPTAVATIKSPTPAGAAQAPSSVPMIKGLSKGSFYVQIGVYGTNDALKTSIAGFKSTSYPLAVEKLTTRSGSAAYRLFVGPLSRDESGVVLIRIRSLGFKDAYVRQGS